MFSSIGSCGQRTRGRAHGNWLDTKIMYLIIWKNALFESLRSSETAGRFKAVQKTQHPCSEKMRKIHPMVFTVAINFISSIKEEAGLSMWLSPMLRRREYFSNKVFGKHGSSPFMGTLRFLFLHPSLLWVFLDLEHIPAPAMGVRPGPGPRPFFSMKSHIFHNTPYFPVSEY